MIDQQEVKITKSWAIIVNTSSGGWIDEGVLKATLDNKMLFGAGIDVYKLESYEGLLRECGNVAMWH